MQRLLPDQGLLCTGVGSNGSNMPRTGTRAVCLMLENSTGMTFPAGLPVTAEGQSSFDNCLLLVELLIELVEPRHDS